MLKGFLQINKKERAKRKFHLYGYFKDSVSEEKILTGDEIKKLLIRQERSTQPGTHLVVINIQKEIGASDQDILDFSSKLNIHVTEEYKDHKQRVIEALKMSCKTTDFEAESFLYPSARTIVSSIAATKDPVVRQLSKAEFISRVSPSHALYNTWSLRELGEKTYSSSLKASYFSHRNIDADHRIFAIDSALVSTDNELLSICHALRRNWSSHGSRRKPNAERYAPFVFFKGLNANKLVALKTLLHEENVQFVDGYVFLGSSFSVDQLCLPQTKTNQLSLRIISSDEDFTKTLTSIKGRCRFLYDFFKDKPVNDSGKYAQISIPVTSVKMIENII